MPEVSNYSRGIFFRKVRSSYSLLSVFSEGLFVLMKRPEFLRMIEDSKKKTFDYVLVYQLDRFARNRYDSANYKAKLKKNGVRVLSAKENITEDASGILIEGVLESMAEYYSAELSQKVKRGIRESYEKGYFIGGYGLFGYDIVDKKWTINSYEADIVRDIFTRYKNGERNYCKAERTRY